MNDIHPITDNFDHLKELPHEVFGPRKYYSILSAAQNGVKYLRDLIWSNPCDHIEIKWIYEGADAVVIDIFVHSPMNMYVYHKDPVRAPLSAIPLDLPIYNEYNGPLVNSEEYLVERNSYPR